jgi:segregation and condensation protein B
MADAPVSRSSQHAGDEHLDSDAGHQSRPWGVGRPEYNLEHGDDRSHLDDSSSEDIETAYRRALAAVEAAERQVSSALGEMAAPEPVPADDESVTAGMSVGSQLADELAMQRERQPGPALLEDGQRRVSPREVVEAAIFVGGDVPLTARRLASLIGQEVDNRVAVSIVDDLNNAYARENRPYEIRLAEGGYRMELREEFAGVLSRTFGLGPREVRLSPEALEVLAFVAWNQPVDREAVELLDRPNAMAMLRQLLRLQLVEIQRTGHKRADITYGTTSRFLKLFGLSSLDELPTADVFAFK